MKPKTNTSSKRTASAQAQTDFECILAQHATDQKPWFHFEKLIRENRCRALRRLAASGSAT
jgi:hypothetical protein